jgi:citrate lyase subunit beta / citryl-CoA lyase
MENIRPRRSVLFMPGSNTRAMEKARSLNCDVVALDLEDAVAPDAKDAARTAICAAISAKAFGGKEVVLRINALSSPWGAEDLKAVAQVRPDAVILPKVGSADDIAALCKRVPEMPDISVWAMIETPQAVLNAAAIAAEAQCLILGSNDLMKDLRTQPMAARENLWAAMSLVVLAARAHGIGAIDGTYNDITDEDGLTAVCKQGRAFGFDGKSLIHPAQVEAANRAFSPSDAEIAAARSVQAAFARNPGASVLALDGRMLERLHAEEAARILALAEAIQTR